MANTGNRNTTTESYTAVIDIKATERTTTTAYNAADEKVSRAVTEISHLVIRANSLRALQTKVAGHIALIGDDD